MRSCLIQVADGELVIIEAPRRLADHAPVAAIEIDTPAVARKLGGATFVRMNGNRWAIDFGRVGLTESIRSGGIRAMLWVACGGGAIKALKRGRSLDREFRSLLQHEGAADRRPCG